jgi:hypothetical protein
MANVLEARFNVCQSIKDTHSFPRRVHCEKTKARSEAGFLHADSARGRGARNGFLLRLGVASVLLTEAINSAFSVDKLLFTGEVGVAVRADIHANLFHRGARGPSRATHASYNGVSKVCWVQILFHASFLLKRN